VCLKGVKKHTVAITEAALGLNIGGAQPQNFCSQYRKSSKYSSKTCFYPNTSKIDGALCISAPL